MEILFVVALVAALLGFAGLFLFLVQTLPQIFLSLLSGFGPLLLLLLSAIICCSFSFPR